MMWATYNEAARIARVLPGTLRVWVARGKVASIRDGHTTLVSIDDVRHAERAWRRRVAPELQPCNMGDQRSHARAQAVS